MAIEVLYPYLSGEPFPRRLPGNAERCADGFLADGAHAQFIDLRLERAGRLDRFQRAEQSLASHGLFVAATEPGDGVGGARIAARLTTTGDATARQRGVSQALSA